MQSADNRNYRFTQPPSPMQLPQRPLTSRAQRPRQPAHRQRAERRRLCVRFGARLAFGLLAVQDSGDFDQRVPVLEGSIFAGVAPPIRQTRKLPSQLPHAGQLARAVAGPSPV